MKKLFTTLFIVLGFCTISFAQEDPGTIQYGVEAGYNYSYANTGDSYIGSRVKTGFDVAFSADYYFSEAWSLKAKVLYDQKGFSNGSLIVSDANGNQTEIDNAAFRLNYITVPLTVNWHAGTDRKWYVNLGPYIGILTSAQSGAYDVKPLFKTIDAGLDAGGGYKFTLNDKLKLFIEIDGQGGLINIASVSAGNGSININMESLNVGIIF